MQAYSVIWYKNFPLYVLWVYRATYLHILTFWHPRYPSQSPTVQTIHEHYSISFEKHWWTSTLYHFCSIYNGLCTNLHLGIHVYTGLLCANLWSIIIETLHLTVCRITQFKYVASCFTMNRNLFHLHESIVWFLVSFIIFLH
jgi:hypothetical protein